MDVRNEILNAHHSLIAGATGSGKSVLLNAVICEGLKRDFDFWFIDLKRVELKQYKKTRNCLAYATEPADALALLGDIIDDMDEEYERMDERDAKETDRPHRYLVIDELAHLVTNKDALEMIVEIGRLGRAAHIHMIGATQDPSRTTLSAQLMQNITCAVALKCKTATESRQIIGEAGAENLPEHGKGYVSTFRGIKKVDIPYISSEEIAEAVYDHRKVSRPTEAVPSSTTKTFFPEARGARPEELSYTWTPTYTETAPVKANAQPPQEDNKLLFDLFKTIIVLFGAMYFVVTPGLLEHTLSTILAAIFILCFIIRGGRRR